MDGYALRTGDIATLPAQLKLIGESAAGHGYAGAVGARECVRILTGAPIPKGADAVLMQEYVTVEGGTVTALKTATRDDNIRGAGLDFSTGDVLLHAGEKLGPVHCALAAAMDHALLPVLRRPRIAILATGDELVKPGEAASTHQIVASNAYAVAGYVRLAGGEPIDLGIAPDDLGAIEAAIAKARDAKADVLVTLGGASVGDRDLVKPALAREGMELGFWRIAMRPGKPLIHGRIGAMPILGLPGNPVSAIVCTVVFLMPLMEAMHGRVPANGTGEPAVLGTPMRANDGRQNFVRAALATREDGVAIATPLASQDSSLLRVLAEADALIIRPPNAPEAKAGDPCRILHLPKPVI
jgi:molybdopterin molybdotransferase